MQANCARSASLLLCASFAGCGGGDGARQDFPGPSLVIAPFITAQSFCDDAVNNVAVQTDDEAALFCASKGKNAANRISAALAALGPATSPSGKYRLGYTLTVPLLRYFENVNGQWVVNSNLLASVLSNVVDINRPVVIYLSSNHFTDAN